MHFMPDTENADAAAETFWPENYKKVIREDVYQNVLAQFNNGHKLNHIYELSYSGRFEDLGQFIDKIAEMITIGAENGADNIFDEIVTAFLYEYPLPGLRQYARYFCPTAFSQAIEEKICQIIADEYRQDDVYGYAYKVGYQYHYSSFEEFISYVSQAVVTGVMNSADDMLGAIYRAFMTSSTLPQARRYPRRLKMWVLPSFKR